MLRWAMALGLVALLAWIFDYAGLAAALAWTAKLVLFALCVVFVIRLADGLVRGWPRELRSLPRAVADSARGAAEATEQVGTAAERAALKAGAALVASVRPQTTRRTT
jgi:uncharacterized membrane protein YtjA (UPF0391 family)